MEQGPFEEIREFIESAQQEELLIEVSPRTWIPGKEWENGQVDEENQGKEEPNIELHVEEGLDLASVFGKLKEISIGKIFFYGKEIPRIGVAPEKIVKKDKNFQECMNLAAIDGNFPSITETSYLFNKKYNSCWAYTIAITSDGMIRPCIHSVICLANIKASSFNAERLIDKLKKYWYLTKDKVKKCKDCELRYVCFDCREIAFRNGGKLSSPNPTCKYDPYKGTWNG